MRKKVKKLNFVPHKNDYRPKDQKNKNDQSNFDSINTSESLSEIIDRMDREHIFSNKTSSAKQRSKSRAYKSNVVGK